MALSTFDFGGGVAVKRSQVITIAGGVATVAALTPVIELTGEGGADDTLTTLTVAGVRTGDTVMLVATAGDTITVDDATIDLVAGTVAVAGDTTLLLRYNGTQWSQVATTISVDNA